MENKSDNIRLFIGTHINLELLFTDNLLTQVQESFNVPLKWLEKENTHITWKFIGDIDKTRISKITNILNDTVNTAGDISINFNQIEIWPNNKFPKQLVITGNDINGKASILYKDINNKLAKLDIKKEKRPFNPHITIARFKNKHKPAESLNIPDYKLDNIKIDITQIDLIQSKLTPQGSIYTILKSYNLKGNGI